MLRMLGLSNQDILKVAVYDLQWMDHAGGGCGRLCGIFDLG